MAVAVAGRGGAGVVNSSQDYTGTREASGQSPIPSYWFSVVTSHRQVSSIHRKRRSRDPRRFLAGEIYREPGQVFGLPEASQGMDSYSFTSYGIRIRHFAENRCGQIGFHKRRTDGVHADIFMAMIDGHTFGEQHDRPLRRGVRRPVAHAIDSEHRGNVD